MTDNAVTPRHIPGRGAAVATCLAASIGVSAILHASSSRPQAALVVPLLWLWGAAALVAAQNDARNDTTASPPEPTRSPSAPRSSSSSWSLAFLLVAVRLPLLGAPLLLSDDAYRFLWEGLVLRSGENPFVSPPSSLPGLDDGLRSLVNHPTIPSIYPPVALLWFQLLSAARLGPPGAQLFGLLADLGSVLLIRRFLLARGRPLWPALLFALHPLAAVESTAGAHLESPAIFLALLALNAPAASPGMASAWTSFWTGLAAGMKLVPLFWWRPRDAWSLAGAAAALTVWLAALVPVLSAGPALFTAWRNYASHWQFDGLLFPWLDPVFGSWTRPVLVALAVPAAVHALRADREVAWLRIGTAFVLLSPTVHPWYVLWAFVPSLLLARWEWPVAAVFLQGSYLVLATLRAGAWDEGWWLWALTWGPVLGISLGHWSRTSRSGKVAPGGAG